MQPQMSARSSCNSRYTRAFLDSCMVLVWSKFFRMPSSPFSNPVTFFMLAFLAAGLVNFFVPSVCGQFAVLAPFMLSDRADVGVDLETAIMAVCYGDQWTNMIHPFWAIPLLAIAGLKMRDILGYTTVVLIASGLVFAATLLLVSL